MPLISDTPEWQQLALYAAGGALLLILLLRVPYVGRALRFLLSFGLLALFLFMLFQQARFDPLLSRFADRLGLGSQEVVGREVRIPMSPDGHFWVQASINGVERRMLVDSGATLTALSERTAEIAAVERTAGPVPVVIRTANGAVRAQTGVVDELDIGGAQARNLRVVISPAFGEVEVLGMNFLSQLASWRVEGRTLILKPEGGATMAVASPSEDVTRSAN